MVVARTDCAGKPFRADRRCSPEPDRAIADGALEAHSCYVVAVLRLRATTHRFGLTAADFEEVRLVVSAGSGDRCIGVFVD